jgi:hypothetical protein
MYFSIRTDVLCNVVMFFVLSWCSMYRRDVLLLSWCSVYCRDVLCIVVMFCVLS